MITTNKIGFKGFVKNLRKYLKDECNTTLTQSQALETTSQLLGFKNYNIFHSKEKDLENTIKLINMKIDNNTKLISDNLNRRFYSFVDDIIDDLNREYLYYTDDKGRFLYFTSPKQQGRDGEDIIFLQKLCLSSIWQGSIEKHIIKYEYDKDGVPFIPKKNELLKKLTKGFSVVPFKQHRNDVAIGITFKNPRKDLNYKLIYFEIKHRDIKARLIFERDNSRFDNYWYEMELNNKKFSDNDMMITKEEVTELADNFNLIDTYAFTNYLIDYERFSSIKHSNMLAADRLMELNQSLFRWIIESQIAGFFNSIYDAANLVINYEYYDERPSVNESFYEAYKHLINKGKDVIIPFYSEDVMFDIKRRTQIS